MQAKSEVRADRSREGAVLLEVLLALALFVFAATVITSSLNSGVERVTRLRAQLHALDLAVSTLSEVKMGMLPAVPAGPEPFDPPFDHWTWQVEATPYAYGSDPGAAQQLVTVIVKNDQNTAAQRLTEILSPPPAAGAMDALDGNGGGLDTGPATPGSTPGP